MKDNYNNENDSTTATEDVIREHIRQISMEVFDAIHFPPHARLSDAMERLKIVMAWMTSRFDEADDLQCEYFTKNMSVDFGLDWDDIKNTDDYEYTRNVLMSQKL